MQLTALALAGLDPGTDDWVDGVVARCAALAPGGHVLIARSLGGDAGGMSGVALILHDEAPAGGPPAAAEGSATYDLIAANAGVAADDGPDAGRYVAILTFDGPLADRWLAATERAGRERIWPALADLPGQVASIQAGTAGAGLLSATIATDVAVFDEMRRRVFATRLLPWEDPSTINGPDRVDVLRVVYSDLPSLAGIAS